MAAIAAFASRHDVVVFVSGRKSSNGRVLFNECQRVNPRSHLVEGPDGILPEWFRDTSTVGICGATSTPKWLMERCKARIENL
jgi:4-hydroxy-3-methylbut-2-enyl diphosphate reductase